MPSLALLFELADGGSDTVSLSHAQQATAFCDYLESHARASTPCTYRRKERLLLNWAAIWRPLEGEKALAHCARVYRKLLDRSRYG